MTNMCPSKVYLINVIFVMCSGKVLFVLNTLFLLQGKWLDWVLVEKHRFFFFANSYHCYGCT